MQRNSITRAISDASRIPRIAQWHLHDLVRLWCERNWLIVQASRSFSAVALQTPCRLWRPLCSRHLQNFNPRCEVPAAKIYLESVCASSVEVRVHGISVLGCHVWHLLARRCWYISPQLLSFELRIERVEPTWASIILVLRFFTSTNGISDTCFSLAVNRYHLGLRLT